MLEEETTVDVENLRIDQNDALPLRDLLVWRLGVTAMDQDCTPEVLAEAAIHCHQASIRCDLHTARHPRMATNPGMGSLQQIRRCSACLVWGMRNDLLSL